MQKPVIRKSFPEDQIPIHYNATDWKPKFEELRSHSSEETLSITLENQSTGALEMIEFRIAGAAESPITTTKWIWGRILSEGPILYDLVFDYVDGQLIHITVYSSAKSAPPEVTAKRAKEVRYAAEITNYDIFSSIDPD